LAAVGDRRDPRDGVHGQPDVARVGEARPSAVDAGADPYDRAGRPGERAHRPLQRDGRVEGGSRALEDGEELVAVGVDAHTAVGPDRRGDDAPHVGEHGAVGRVELLKEAGRALHVHQEEGHVPGGEHGTAG
jgi:hypothetical protein